MNLVFLITIVVEDFSNQRTPHQFGVSMLDLKQEDSGIESMRKVAGRRPPGCFFKTVLNIRLYIFFVFFETRTKDVFKSLTDVSLQISTSDQQMSKERACRCANHLRATSVTSVTL